MPWKVRFEDGKKDFIEVRMGDTEESFDPVTGAKVTTQDAAIALAERQNKKLAEEHKRPEYKLVSAEYYTK